MKAGVRRRGFRPALSGHCRAEWGGGNWLGACAGGEATSGPALCSHAGPSTCEVSGLPGHLCQGQAARSSPQPRTHGRQSSLSVSGPNSGGGLGVTERPAPLRPFTDQQDPLRFCGGRPWSLPSCGMAHRHQHRARPRATPTPARPPWHPARARRSCRPGCPPCCTGPTMRSVSLHGAGTGPGPPTLPSGPRNSTDREGRGVSLRSGGGQACTPAAAVSVIIVQSGSPEKYKVKLNKRKRKQLRQFYSNTGGNDFAGSISLLVLPH